MAPELHLNSYTWVQDEKLGFQSRLSQNRRNVSCVLSGVFVLDRRLLVNVSLGGGASCQMPQNPKCSLYRGYGQRHLSVRFLPKLVCDFLIMWQQQKHFLAKKMESKQKLVSPDRNVQKRGTLLRCTQISESWLVTAFLLPASKFLWKPDLPIEF